jgi:hypothetical protein
MLNFTRKGHVSSTNSLIPVNTQQLPWVYENLLAYSNDSILRDDADLLPPACAQLISTPGLITAVKKQAFEFSV